MGAGMYHLLFTNLGVGGGGIFLVFIQKMLKYSFSIILRKKLIFATNSNCPLSLSLQPDFVDLRYFKR